MRSRTAAPQRWGAENIRVTISLTFCVALRVPPCGGVLFGEDRDGVVHVEFVAAVVAHDGVGFDVDAEASICRAEGVGAVVRDECAPVAELSAAGVVEADVAVGAAADSVAAFVDQFVVEPA